MSNKTYVLRVANTEVVGGIRVIKSWRYVSVDAPTAQDAVNTVRGYRTLAPEEDIEAVFAETNKWW